jgi:[DsrC]-trisulfide reductase subunit J
LWLLLVAVLAFAAPVLAADRDSSRVPRPVIEAGKGERCVETTDFMRRNHMELLRHQRDATTHQGIRTRNHSLNGCIECHASRKNNSVVGSEQNFCQSCHSYAAVKLDCFECHASKPKAPAERAAQKQAGISQLLTDRTAK